MRLLPDDRRDGRMPYVWLVYLGLYIGYPFVVGTTPWEWAAQAAGLAAFLPLYFAGYWLEGGRRLPVIAGLTVLGVALTWLNPGAPVFFVYATSFVGGARTGRAAIAWIVGITMVGLAASLTAGQWALFAAGFAGVFGPIIGFVNVNAAEARRREAALRMAHDEIARLAALAERDRIAADLHDLLGHTLSVIVLKADLAARLIDRDPARAAVEVAEVSRVSREALAEVRQAVQGFQTASVLDELSRAVSVLTTAGVTVGCDREAIARVVGEGVSHQAERALALILREAVTNVVRHARARHFEVTVTREGERIRLVVQDDGIGGALMDGNGLASMRRRAASVGVAGTARNVRRAAGRGGARVRDAGGGARMIRVVIAEDQAMVLGALAALLETEDGIAVVGRAATGVAALDLVRELAPDVLVTDIEMPGTSGLDVAAEISRTSRATRVVILTTFARPGYLRRALDAGASGYLLKDAPSAQLAEAIRRVHAGGRVIDPALAADAWSEADPLTDRERQVLRLAADGLTSSDIAATLQLSEGTVRNYLSEAISKMGARNRVEAANLARARGWL